jgi:transmembrane sensor
LLIGSIILWRCFNISAKECVMKDNSLINNIIIKAITDEELTSAETAILEQWLTDTENSKLFGNLKNKDYLLQKLIAVHEIDVKGDKALIEEKMAIGKHISIQRQRQWKLFRDVATSAAAVLILAAATFFWFNTRKPDNDNNTKVAKEKPITIAPHDIAPGQLAASLTLADGKKLVLDSTAAGQLAEQGGTLVINGKGTLTYEANDEQQNAALYNTLSTANGETYGMVLADGSKVWLNAGASIRYPVAFTGNERRVEITGEAYFEVTHDKSKPFIVHVSDHQGGGMDVQVLGTHFNINAYNDEAVIKTTLLEGSVKIVNRQSTFAGASADEPANDKEKSIVLKPGEQAQVGDGVTKVIHDANVDAVIAWKNGRFNFDNADITIVMRQLAKWYNVEVVYEGPKPTQLLVWEAERNQMLSQVVKLLEYTGVHSRIEGQKLIVMAPEYYEARKNNMKQQK